MSVAKTGRPGNADEFSPGQLGARIIERTHSAGAGFAALADVIDLDRHGMAILDHRARNEAMHVSRSGKCTLLWGMSGLHDLSAGQIVLASGGAGDGPEVRLPDPPAATRITMAEPRIGPALQETFQDLNVAVE